MGDEVKRDVRPFEPPPWEREAFEALARRKAEEQAALDLLSVPRPSAKAPVEPQVEEATGAEDPAPVATPAPAAMADERRVQAMLLELSREETTDTGHITLVARIAAVITAAVGIGMLVGGLLTLSNSQDAAKRTLATTMASGALSVFGLCFVAIGVWVWIRSNRVKGSR